MSRGAFVVISTVCFSWAVAVSYVSKLLWEARQRCYRYAVQQTERHDAIWRADWKNPSADGVVAFAKSCAYSDMATVITLDGNVDDERLEHVGLGEGGEEGGGG